MVGKFTLPDEKVFVKFIKNPSGNITNKRHVAYGGLLENSVIELPAKKLNNGQFANVLSDNEKLELEVLMQMEKNALSVYKKADNYWSDIKIRLTKEGAYFNLSDPEEFIKVKVLGSYTDFIADSLAQYNEKKKATYKFIIVRANEEDVTFNKEIDIKKQAYILFGKIEDSQKSMEDFLSMVKIKVAAESSKDWLKSQVGKYLEEKPKDFLAILNDRDYAIKIVIKKAVNAKVIRVSGGLYQTSEGENIAHKNQKPTLVNVIKFLNSSDGQDIRMLIESKLEE